MFGLEFDVSGGVRVRGPRRGLPLIVLLAVMLVGSVPPQLGPPPVLAAPPAAQILNIGGVYDATEAPSPDVIVVELTQTGTAVEGTFTRNDVPGTLMGSVNGPKFVGDWKADDGTSGVLDMDIVPNAGRLEGVWTYEQPNRTAAKQIWMKR